MGALKRGELKPPYELGVKSLPKGLLGVVSLKFSEYFEEKW